MKLSKKVLVVVVLAIVLALIAVPSVFADGTVDWTGQGTINGELETEICGIENGAEVDGPYLLWIFTATQADSATITINGVTYPMSQPNGQGTYKYVSGWYDLNTVVASATYVGDTPGNPQLTISHGCPPAAPPEWCSPGYWRNHLDEANAAAAAGGFALSDTYASHFGAAPALSPKGVKDIANPNPTLLEVLQSPQYYGGDAFNAVGDLLSAAHPDVNFTGERVEDSCPLN